jgi:hypothetical protein
MHECSIGFLELFHSNFYLYNYWPDLFTSSSRVYHNIYFFDHLKTNSTLPCLGNALIWCFFKLLVDKQSQTTDEGPIFSEHQESGHRWRAKYSPNTKSQTTSEGPIFSEHQEADYRWRANIFQTRRVRPRMKGHIFSEHQKPDHWWRAKYSSNTKSQITDEGPIFSELQEPDHR